MNDDRAVLRVRIGPGQTQLRKVSRGSRITLAAGSIRVDGPPKWLAETMVRNVAMVRPGAPVELHQAGWVALNSDHGAEVLIEHAAVPSSSALEILRALLQRCRRKIGGVTLPSHAA